MATTKEVTVKQSNSVSAFNASSLLNMAPKADMKDIKFSKIKIHQGTTMGRKGMVGDIYETTTSTTLVGPGEKLSFVPITYYKRWFHNEKKPGENQPKPKGQTAFEHENQFKWKEVKADGTEIGNIRAVCFFAMLEKDLDDPSAFPCLIMFYSTNFTAAGRDLITRYEQLRAVGIEPWLNVFTLETSQAKDKPHQIFKVMPKADKNGQVTVDKKYVDTMRKWAQTVLTMQAEGTLTSIKEVDDVIDTAEVDAGSARTAKPLNESELQF